MSNVAPFHSLTVEETLHLLNSSHEGLSANEAKAGLIKYGFNEFPQTKQINPFILFIRQFKSSLVYILFIAAIISWLADHEIDTFVILFIVIVNAIIGFTQEFRAERAVGALRQMIKQSAIALRNGNKIKISARELVPGDIIFVEEGDKIPADSRLIKANNLRAVESSLTGESLPVSKNVQPMAINTPVAD